MVKMANKSAINWKRLNVQAFLTANKEEYDLNNEDNSTVKSNKVPGYAFLQLTKEEVVGCLVTRQRFEKHAR